MPAINSLDELFKHELKDLYSAETQIIEALPKMIKAATEVPLKKALYKHFQVTKTQKKRLDEIQSLLGEKKTATENKGFFANLFKGKEGAEHCKAMEGLIKEGNTLLKQKMTAEVKDAAIIAAAQKIEHYEISSYGTAHAFAVQLQLNKVAELLATTLKEEYEADNLLTQLALSKVNYAAEPGLRKPVKQPKKVSVKKAKKTSPKKVKAAKKKEPEGSANTKQPKE